MTYDGLGEASLADILLRIIALLLVIVNVIGNTLVVLIILKDRSMRTPINYLLLNLAITDMMAGVFSFPSTVLNHLITQPSGRTGDFLCKFLTGMSLAWLAIMVSAFSLAFIAVERFYAVVHPLDFRHKVTFFKIKLFVSSCWVVALCLSLPDFFFTTYDGSACQMNWESEWMGQIYAVVCVIIGGVGPSLVMVVLYSKVIRHLWFQRECTTNFMRQAIVKSRKRISRIMVMVSVIYTVTCLPNHLCYLVQTFSSWTISPLEQYVLTCLLVFNSAVNPFLYSLQSQRFNASVKKLFLRGSS